MVVIRGNDIQEALSTVGACYRGGIKVIEVTFTLPRADALIKILSEKYANSDMLIGAGTVLDSEE